MASHGSRTVPQVLGRIGPASGAFSGAFSGAGVSAGSLSASSRLSASPGRSNWRRPLDSLVAFKKRRDGRVAVVKAVESTRRACEVLERQQPHERAPVGEYVRELRAQVERLERLTAQSDDAYERED